MNESVNYRILSFAYLYNLVAFVGDSAVVVFVPVTYLTVMQVFAQSLFDYESYLLISLRLSL